MKNKELKLKYIDFLKKGKKTKQPKIDSSYGEEYKYPVTHMNELIVTPNGTELGSVTSDAMLDNLVTTYILRQAKDKRDLSNMVRHIHSGTETAAKWLAPLVIAPVAATLPWGTVGRGATKGLEFLGKAMTPSSYLGTGTYTTALGETNASLGGALADAGLAGYYGVEAYNTLKNNPNLLTVTNAALATVPAVGLASKTILPLTKTKNIISIGDLLLEAKAILNPMMQRSRPYLWNKINNSPELKELVTRIAAGDESLELPLFIGNTKPNLGTVLETILYLNANNLPKTLRFLTSYEGIQPIEGKYLTTKSWGNYDFSSSDLWNASQYGDVGRAEWGSLKLMLEGFTPNSPLYLYAMKRYKTILGLLNKYKVKWGKYGKNWEQNPQSRIAGSIKLTNYGKNEVNMSLENLGQMSKRDAKKYQKAIRELTQFWGSGEESLHAGGVRQRVVAVPKWENRFTIRRTGEPLLYTNLGLSSVYLGPLFTGIVKDLTGKQDMKGLSIYGRLKKWPFFLVENVLDPKLGTTYGFDLNKGIWGYKKGGKL